MFSPVTAAAASEKGALNGFKSQCSCCGMVIKSSMEVTLRHDMVAHAAWHARAK